MTLAFGQRAGSLGKRGETQITAVGNLTFDHQEAGEF
jgi:hypothetical protein